MVPSPLPGLVACRAERRVEGGRIDVDVDTFRVANEGRADRQGVSGFEWESCLDVSGSGQELSSSPHGPSTPNTFLLDLVRGPWFLGQ